MDLLKGGSTMDFGDFIGKVRTMQSILCLKLS